MRTKRRQCGAPNATRYSERKNANRAPLNHQKRKLELSDESKQSQSNIRKSGKLLSKRRWQRDGEIFEEGDDVYVVLDEKIIGPGSILEESAEDEADNCSVCKKAGRKARIECGKCMSCFHLECLSPPLEDVPQGIWICQDCCSGKPPRTQRALVSAREYVLQQKGLGLARIERVFLDKTKDEYFADCRWFYLPEETHIGRQNHHTAREMFLSSLRDRISMDTVLRHAKVITLAEYSLEGEAENDMFICDYEYDEQWGRFFRITEWDGNNEISKDDESDDEEKDSTFTLSDALELNCDLKRKKFYKRKKSQGGGVQRCLQLGITSVPDQERLSKNSNSILNASKALSLTAIPDSMPCREKERSEIEDFVRKTLSLGTVRDGSGKCLYICGIPGTGKTATVLDVLRNFSTGSNHNMKKSFHLIEINGLQLPSPLHVYSRIYEALTGEAAGPSSAMQALEEIFAGTSKRGSKSRRHIIVMLDEMDSVVSKSQKALYNLFDWPSRNASNFSIIGIANTMDLPERLHPRIGSRLAGAKVVFHPYQRDHLEQIMKSRLKDSQLFEENAVILAARKVANCSGDVRRCLELCRRAIEISLGKKKSNKMNIRVTIQDVDAAIKEAFNTPNMKMLEGCTKTQLLILCAVYLETCYSGQQDVHLDSVYERLHGMLPGRSLSFPQLLQNTQLLSTTRLLLSDGRNDRLKLRLSLNIGSDDLSYSLAKHNDHEVSSMVNVIEMASNRS